jgi:hypothetical protein
VTRYQLAQDGDATSVPSPTWRCGGCRPSPDDAEEAIRQLRAHGPTPAAFTLREHFPPPDLAPSGPRTAPDDWMCPA